MTMTRDEANKRLERLCVLVWKQAKTGIGGSKLEQIVTRSSIYQELLATLTTNNTEKIKEVHDDEG